MESVLNFATTTELKERLVSLGYEGTIVLENPDFLSAIIGIDTDGRLIYRYDLMVEHLMETEGWDYVDAVEFIDYNTVRAIPYMGDMAPIICYSIEE